MVSDGQAYAILLSENLPITRERQIMDDFVFGKLKITGHVFVPDEETLNKLREEKSKKVNGLELSY